jgi:hypothetical protein
LEITCYPTGRDAAGVKAAMDTQLDAIELLLDSIRKHITQSQRALKARISDLVSNRCAIILADREVLANLGFPIERRPDANPYTVPLRRRHVVLKERATQQGPTRRFEPEPVLLDDDYEAALAVLRNLRNALERTFLTTRRFSEEQIRDVLLAGLNALFEGAAAGEVFNGAGKTDILIRVGDVTSSLASASSGTDPRPLPTRSTNSSAISFGATPKPPCCCSSATRMPPR